MQGFEAIALADGTLFLNEFDCPLFSWSQTVLLVESTDILAAVSFVHECDEACTIVERNVQLTQEEKKLKCQNLYLNITGVTCFSVTIFVVYNK